MNQAVCDTVGHQNQVVYHHVQIDGGGERPADLCDTCLAYGLTVLLNQLTPDQQGEWLKGVLSGVNRG